MNETKRKRLEKQILRLTSEITYRKLKNIEMGFITYTGCSLKEDASRAEITVAVYTELENGNSIKNLNRAAGFFRSLIGKSLGLRNSPEICFVPDTSAEKVQRIDSLLDK
ncbi:MAG: 30S ribosome-binding factor RbfA [Spirochaetia bacterium]|nr:30S ribosome-binding factor RbfA [Spirochaetia bacterium]